MIRIAIACVITLSVIVGSSSAAPILVNGGFETPDIPDGTFVRSPMSTGWVFDDPNDGSGINDPNSAFSNIAAPDGSQQYAFLQDNSSPTRNGTFFQDISGFNVGDLVFVDFFAAGRAAGSGANPFSVSLDGMAVGLFTPMTGTFQSFSTTIPYAATTNTVRLRFDGLGNMGAGGDRTSFIDDVSLRVIEAPISTLPEPASMLLWGVGALGLGLVGYRRKKSLA
jgi:hypothetical protein